MRRRIAIANETRYRTADIRQFLRKAAEMVFDPGQKAIIRCRVVYAHRRNVSGCATIGGTLMTLRIGKDVQDKREVGAVAVHEMGHLRGLDHFHMRGAALWTDRGLSRVVSAQTGESWSARERWLRAHQWAADLTLREEQPNRKPRLAGMDLVEVRRERVLEALGRWSKKAKRAATAMKKLRGRLKYYDRRAAAMTAGKE